MTGSNDIKELIEKASSEINFDLKSFSALTGGDINEVFLLTSATNEKLVIKINNANKFSGMFAAEMSGLNALAAPNCIDIPKALYTGEYMHHAYLLLEHKRASAPNEDFWEVFGNQLAKLHQTTSENFGFNEDNYIANLRQYNTWNSSASEFYISQRLEPQLQLAKDNGYLNNSYKNFFKNISNLIPNEAPALTHGDLWNGNFIINEHGKPCLIDPAVSFAPRELDLALMHMFGGFNERLFESYHLRFPIIDGFKERLEIWQLYYLLVHLNIFGLGYKTRVEQILMKFN